MKKITDFTIINKNTIELKADAKKGDQIDLSVQQKIDFSLFDEQIQKQFRENLDNELAKQKKELEKQSNEQQEIRLKAAKQEIENKYLKQEADLKNKIQSLQNEKDASVKATKDDCEKDFLKQKSELEIKLQSKISELNNALKAKDEKHKLELENKDQQHQIEIDKILKARSFSNSKQVGEDLEKWCNQQFEDYQSIGAFNNCEWSKINKVNNHEKADYMFKVFSPNGSLLTSVCCEMKNEQDIANLSSKKKNSDHYKKLDRNRNDEHAEFALLVSTLEKDEEFLIKRVKEYPNMYVIRPQYFITFLALVAQVNESFKEKIDEWNQEKKQMNDVCLSKQEMENKINALKQSIFENSIKNIINKINNINSQAEKIQNCVQDIIESSRVILETHINSLKNKIESFSWKKVLKNVELINNFQEKNILDSNLNSSNIAYCKPKKED